MKRKQKVFVYGTLRKGFPLHKHLSRSEAKYIGRGSIQGILYDLGEYPGVLASGRGEVKGELYELQNGEEQLRRLDDLEEFDSHRPESSLFVRSLTDVKVGTGRKIRAWVYFLPSKPMKAEVIRSGDYREKKVSAIGR